MTIVAPQRRIEGMTLVSTPPGPKHVALIALIPAPADVAVGDLLIDVGHRLGVTGCRATGVLLGVALTGRTGRHVRGR